MNLRWIEKDGRKFLQEKLERKIQINGFSATTIVFDWYDVPIYYEDTALNRGFRERIIITEELFNNAFNNYLHVHHSPLTFKKELGF
jgi:hypothetical protein